MSVKSTIFLTRDKAEKRYIELYNQLNPHPFNLSHLSDEEIEDELERMDDELHDGESFNNYRIDVI